jgi:hypothetical protein
MGVLIVPLLGKNIKNISIRKIKPVRKSLSKSAHLRWQIGANFSLPGIHTPAALDRREVIL